MGNIRRCAARPGPPFNARPTPHARSDRPMPGPVEITPALDSEILQLLMNTIPDRIYFKDLQSRIVRNNLAHARGLGATPDECLGKSDFDFFSREHAQVAFAEEQEIIRTGEPV